jgi:hypothetical protein
MRTSLLKTRFLQSAAIIAVASAASVGAAAADPTISASNANVLNLLSPFLSLNDPNGPAGVAGLQTLSDNLAQAIAINNASFSGPFLLSPPYPANTPALQALAYSDKNLLGSAQNSVTGLTGSFGVAANLAGGLPDQPAPVQNGVTGVPGVQRVGGFGGTLGQIHANGVNAYANGDHTVLPNTVNLLTSAYNFTSSDLGVAKNYFANGNASNSGTTPPFGPVAVAPAGYSVPTYNGLPNTTNSVYDNAYNVNNQQPGQNIYGNSRPAQVSSQIKIFDPTALNGINTNPSFPSGHTTYAYTDSILLGMMVPQLYQSMLVRASEYANSRIVLGVHYPLDIIASRAFVQYDLAQALSNPSYINSTVTGPLTNGSGTKINMPSLLNQATPELNGYLTQQLVNNPQLGCGTTISGCISAQSNPYAPSAANAAAYAGRLTYGLPTVSAPPEQAPTGTGGPAGDPDPAILLATVFGGSTAAAQTLAPNGGMNGKLATSTIDQILVNTEGPALSAFYGTSLSYWTRINLYAAVGYFEGVTGTLNTANGDHVFTDVTVESGGVLNVAGQFTVDGAFTLDPSTLGVFIDGLVPVTEYSQIDVAGKADLDGKLDVTLGNGFTFSVGDKFDLVIADGGVRDDLSSLVLDGLACTGSGGGFFSCDVGGRFEKLWLGVTGGTDLTLAAVPEPSTWALLLAGFAGLGFAGYRRATATPRTIA